MFHSLFLAQQYDQTEYGMGYLLVAAFIVLGLLAICVPRPRRSNFLDPEEEKKLKAEKARRKKKKKKKKKKKS